MPAHPPNTLPDPMDVVWCRFPYDEKPGRPGREPHPGLVFETNEYREGQYAVKVAFGTSNVQRPNGPHFVVSNFNAMRIAGLNKVTCFDLGRSKWLVWTTDWFESPDPAKYATPVIGSIGQDGQAALGVILRRRRDAGLPVP